MLGPTLPSKHPRLTTWGHHGARGGRGVMSLTHDHRQVLFEVFYHGRCAREAATAPGIPEGTVKSRMFHVLRATGGAGAVRRVATPGRSRGTRAPPEGSLHCPAVARPR
jgi:hypothetical protein